MLGAAPSSKGRQPEEGQRIRLRHPTRVPVICVSADGGLKCKLLVPRAMLCEEFANIARDKCEWATCLSRPFAGGRQLTAEASMSELDSQHKSSDGYFYVTIADKNAHGEAERVAHARAAENEGSCARATATDDDTKLSETGQQPLAFYTEDCVPESSDAKRAKRVLHKYPDRVPVLFRQGAMLGLPAIDRKLLVPNKMRCDELKHVLRKQLGGAGGDVDWGELGIAVGATKLSSAANVKEIYDQYKDLDECLHVRLAVQSAHEPETSTSALERAAAADEMVAAAEERVAALEVATEREQTAELGAAAAHTELEERAKAAEENARREAERAETLEASLHASEDACAEAEKRATSAEKRATSAEATLQKVEAELREAEGRLRAAEEHAQASLMAAEDCADEEAQKAEAAEAALKALSERLAVESERLLRAEKAKEEAQRKAAEGDEASRRLEDLLKAKEEKLVAGGCYKAAVEMELKRAHEEIQRLLKNVDAAEKKASDMAHEAAVAEAASNEAEEKARRSLSNEDDDFVHIGSERADAVDDWSCV